MRIIAHILASTLTLQLLAMQPTTVTLKDGSCLKIETTPSRTTFTKTQGDADKQMRFSAFFDSTTQTYGRSDQVGGRLTEYYNQELSEKLFLALQAQFNARNTGHSS